MPKTINTMNKTTEISIMMVEILAMILTMKKFLCSITSLTAFNPFQSAIAPLPADQMVIKIAMDRAPTDS